MFYGLEEDKLSLFPTFSWEYYKINPDIQTYCLRLPFQFLNCRIHLILEINTGKLWTLLHKTDSSVHIQNACTRIHCQFSLNL
jgi:hypothetical protein